MLSGLVTRLFLEFCNDKIGPAHIARHRDYSNPDKGETCVMFAIREIQGDTLLSSKLQFMDIHTKSVNFVDGCLNTITTKVRLV